MKNCSLIIITILLISNQFEPIWTRTSFKCKTLNPSDIQSISRGSLGRFPTEPRPPDGYERGHIIGWILGGQISSDNLVWMKSNVNRGDFAKKEQFVARMLRFGNCDSVEYCVDFLDSVSMYSSFDSYGDDSWPTSSDAESTDAELMDAINSNGTQKYIFPFLIPAIVGAATAAARVAPIIARVGATAARAGAGAARAGSGAVRVGSSAARPGATVVRTGGVPKTGSGVRNGHSKINSQGKVRCSRGAIGTSSACRREKIPKNFRPQKPNGFRQRWTCFKGGRSVPHLTGSMTHRN